jgi:hypothetical protein
VSLPGRPFGASGPESPPVRPRAPAFAVAGRDPRGPHFL